MVLRLGSVLVFAASACAPATPAPEVSESTPAPAPVAVEAPVPAPTPQAEAKPAPMSAPTPVVASTFDRAVAELVAGHRPLAESVERAWVHYRSEEFSAAQREFALASLHDRAGWKHPFNLACASARAKDEALVKVGLVEALARAPKLAAKKAKKDRDLESYRSALWFEAALAKAAMGESTRPAPGPFVTRPPPPTSSPISSGTAKPLAKRELARIHKRLAAMDGVAPRVRASLTFDDANGTQIAFVVYDFTLSARCKAKFKGDREALADCLADLQPEEPDRSELGNQTQCVEQYLIRVELGPELVVADPDELEVACDPNKVRRLDLVDLDGDGQLEVVLDTIGMAKTLDVAGEDVGASNRARHFAILRLDGEVQYKLVLDGDAELPIDKITRVFVQPGVDGHPNLVEQTVSGLELDDDVCAPASVDTDFWPSCAEKEWPAVEVVVLPYDAKADRWVRPGE